MTAPTLPDLIDIDPWPDLADPVTAWPDLVDLPTDKARTTGMYATCAIDLQAAS